MRDDGICANFYVVFYNNRSHQDPFQIASGGTPSRKIRWPLCQLSSTPLALSWKLARSHERSKAIPKYANCSSGVSFEQRRSPSRIDSRPASHSSLRSEESEMELNFTTMGRDRARTGQDLVKEC